MVVTFFSHSWLFSIKCHFTFVHLSIRRIKRSVTSFTFLPLSFFTFSIWWKTIFFKVLNYFFDFDFVLSLLMLKPVKTTEHTHTHTHTVTAELSSCSGVLFPSVIQCDQKLSPNIGNFFNKKVAKMPIQGMFWSLEKKTNWELRISMYFWTYPWKIQKHLSYPKSRHSVSHKNALAFTKAAQAVNK